MYHIVLQWHVITAFRCWKFPPFHADILAPKNRRPGTKAGVAKRLMISSEMQTFMKDSKSSRKAAGIPGWWDGWGWMGMGMDRMCWMVARILGECVCIYIYICMYVCMYVYIYIYIIHSLVELSLAIAEMMEIGDRALKGTTVAPPHPGVDHRWWPYLWGIDSGHGPWASDRRSATGYRGDLDSRSIGWDPCLRPVSNGKWMSQWMFQWIYCSYMYLVKMVDVP